MTDLKSSEDWRMIDGIATVFSQSYLLARARAVDDASKVIQLQAERDQLHYENCLLRRELGIYQRQRAALPPKTAILLFISRPSDWPYFI